MPISTLRGYPRIGGVIGYGPVGGSGVWTLQERYALADDFYDDVSLLLKMNGSNGSTTFLDSSKHGHAVTANGNAQISTAQSKFGGSSLALDGTGDWITTAISNEFVFGTDPFTVEFWIYWDGTVTGTPFMGVMGVHNAGGTGRYGIFLSASGITHYIQSGLPAVSTLPQSEWVHVASTRDSSGDCRLFINGVLQNTTNDSGNLTAPEGFRVGNEFTSGRPAFPGYIDSLRITKGKARYTAAFTPPQREFLP